MVSRNVLMDFFFCSPTVTGLTNAKCGFTKRKSSLPITMMVKGKTVHRFFLNKKIRYVYGGGDPRSSDGECSGSIVHCRPVQTKARPQGSGRVEGAGVRAS
jgi:hypothetical protein